jgi:hypothetical protein
MKWSREQSSCIYWSSQIALNFEFLSVYYLAVNVGQYIVAAVKVKSRRGQVMTHM